MGDYLWAKMNKFGLVDKKALWDAIFKIMQEKNFSLYQNDESHNKIQYIVMSHGDVYQGDLGEIQDLIYRSDEDVLIIFWHKMQWLRLEISISYEESQTRCDITLEDGFLSKEHVEDIVITLKIFWSVCLSIYGLFMPHSFQLYWDEVAPDINLVRLSSEKHLSECVLMCGRKLCWIKYAEINEESLFLCDPFPIIFYGKPGKTWIFVNLSELQV